MPAADTLLLRLRAAGARTTAREIDSVGAAVKRTGGAAAATRGTLSGMGSGLRVMQTGLKGAGKGMVAAGAGLKQLTLPILLVGGLSMKMAIDFEDSMDRIRGLVGASRSQVHEWSQDILAMARTLPVGPQELADALFFVASAGFKGEQAMNVLHISAKAAAAGLGDTKTVADAVTSALNAYHLQGSQAVSVTDTLVNAVRLGKMPVTALAGAIGGVLPIAAEAGVKFNEVAGFAAALSRSGADVKRTMTGVRFLLTGLINPSSKAAGVLKGVGLSAADVRNEIKQKGLLATLTDLKKRLPIQDFLTVTGGARGVAIGLGAVGKNSKQVAEVLDQMGDSSGRTNKAFNIASHTAKFRLGKAMSSLKAAMVELGNVIIPVVVPILEDIAKALSSVAHWFQGLSPTMKKSIVIFLLVLAVLGPILLIVGGIAIALSALMTVTAGVVAGVAILAAGLVYAYTKWGWFRDIVKVVWELFKITPLGLIVTHLGDIARAAVDVGKAFGKIPAAIKSGFVSAVNWMIDRLNDLIWAVNKLIDGINAVKPGNDIGKIDPIGHVGGPTAGGELRYGGGGALNPFTGRPMHKRRPRQIPMPRRPGQTASTASAGGGTDTFESHYTVELDGRVLAKGVHKASRKKRSTS